MHTTNLRRVGGSVMLAVPLAFLEQLHLGVGAAVGLAVSEDRLVIAVFRGKPGLHVMCKSAR